MPARHNLFENWNRYYDPSIGRYLQPEMAWTVPRMVVGYSALGASLPVYGYALNNPGGYVDKDGRIPVLYVALGIAAVYVLYSFAVADSNSFDANRLGRNFGTDRNGVGDAIRHCTWACMNSFSAGRLGSWLATSAYEGWTWSDNTEEERRMDLNNNRCGRDIADHALGSEKCMMECSDAFQAGRLQTLNPPQGGGNGPY